MVGINSSADKVAPSSKFVLGGDWPLSHQKLHQHFFFHSHERNPIHEISLTPKKMHNSLAFSKALCTLMGWSPPWYTTRGRLVHQASWCLIEDLLPSTEGKREKTLFQLESERQVLGGSLPTWWRVRPLMTWRASNTTTHLTPDYVTCIFDQE